MQPHEAAKLIDIHPNTVRTWTADNRYRRFFSLSAQGGNGQEREITDDDVRILAYINQLKDQGRQADEVEAALIQVEKAGFDTLPMPHHNGALVPTPVIPVAAAEEAVKGEHRALEILRAETQERLKEQREQMTYERGRADQERERYEESNKRVHQLEHTVGVLEGKLEILERQLGRGKKK